MENLDGCLQKLYTDKQIRAIDRELEEYTQNLKRDEESIRDNTLWYKNINLYVVYPDGIEPVGEENYIQALTRHLDHVATMGFNAIHILPFLDSPMVDKGYDVSNYFKIRPDLGTLADMKRLLKRANELNLKVFMDLVVNHVSSQHEWFKKAQAGDQQYRDYFFYRKQPPQLLGIENTQGTVLAHYNDNGKKESDIVIFPEACGDIPHWRQGSDDLWYYHIFYPDQLDVNWLNPHVFLEYAKILIYWGNLGLNFRLDAILAAGKTPYKGQQNDQEHLTKTYAIIASLNAIAQYINPNAVLLVETFDDMEVIISTFGNINARQAQLAYNFFLNTNMWVSMTLGDVGYTWKILEEQKHIPIHATWLNFLRNHDELNFAHLDADVIQKMQDKLLPLGKSFRDGLGVSGRTFSLLKNNKKRLYMACLLLASMPGSMLLVYGDEIGKESIPFQELTNEEKKDTRNINRGLVTTTEMKSKQAREIQTIIQNIIHQRAIFNHYVNIWPQRVQLTGIDRGVFAARYAVGASELLILINLDSEPKVIDIDTRLYASILEVNKVQVTKLNVKLGSYAGIWLQK